MSHLKQPQTSGGLRLRALREACGKTQLDVELDANLGIGYLQRLELGKVQQPEQDTLNRILDALGTRFIERREVLALFGYSIPITLPDDAEIQWAVDIFHAQVKGQTIPVYLLDCGHRLLAWNDQTAHMFHGLNTRVRTPLLPRLIFDSVAGIADAILNTGTFFSAQIRVIQYEHQRCGNQLLYNTLIDEMRTVPAFVQYWENGSLAARVQVPMRPLVPMQLVTRSGLAQFRLIAENFVQDPRFRVIYYLPDDPATLRQCLNGQLEVLF